MITADTWKSGMADGLRTTATLLKVVLPLFAFVRLLEQTPLVGWIAAKCDPWMGLLGLPGEAALALVTGMALNFYAAIGIIIALELTAWEVTVVAIMLCCAHELVIETAIIRRTGVRAWPILAIRLATALVAGGIMNLLGKLSS